MKLLKIELQNFKGLRSFTFAPNGRSVSVYGRNESGKTTLFDALTWLLTGKDSRDRSPDSFGIKTRNGSGEVLHGLEHSVEGVFDSVTLKKVYKEKWTRKRGSSKEEFSGHTTDHFIDGVPVQAGEYQEAVEKIMPERLLKILTMPDYFPEQMHWSDRRDILFDLAGDIADADVIASAEGLERYPEVLGDRTHEAQEKVLKARKRELNKELDNIPSRIDEVSRMIEDVEGVEEAKNEIEELKEKKAAIEEKISKVRNGGDVSKLKVQIEELESEKIKLRNTHQESIDDSLKAAREKVDELQDKVDEASDAVREQTRVYKGKEARVDTIENGIKRLNDHIETIGQRQPKEDTGPKTCPVCERPMEEDSEHSYEDYLKEFNAEKASDLKEAKSELDIAEKELKEAQADLEEAKDKGLKLRAKLNQVEPALKKARQALEEKKSAAPNVEESDEWKNLVEQQETLREKIDNHQAEKKAQLEELDRHVQDIDRKIEQASKVLLQVEQNKKAEARIGELQAERKEVAEQLESTEADLHLMEEFVRARSAYVTERVNARFEHVSWKLFEEQINGGLTETCTAVFKGVPFDQGLNNAGRIQAGIDIINTLSAHYGKSAPVFVDNRESVSELPETDLQVISLIVSPDHKKLTVEQTNERELVNA